MTRTVLITEKQVTRILTIAEGGPPGPQGPPGNARLETVGATALSGHTAVAVNAAGLLVPADATNPAHLGAIIGLVSRSYAPGDAAEIQDSYVLGHSGWSWATGAAVLAGVGGALTQTTFPGARFLQVVGFAIAPTKILVHIHPPINIR